MSEALDDERWTSSFSPSKDGDAASTDAVGVGVGTVVSGKYVVERLIGSGGMGFVMAAMHMTLGERVALKFLFTETRGSAAARFLREARIAARLKSEHVARLMDVGANERGEPYLVLEYLEGQNLGRVIDKRGALPISEAVDLVLQACVGVAEAHSIRIVHRDLKPSNLFLTERPDGSPLVKVLDFGIAKLLSGSLVGALSAPSRSSSSPFDIAREVNASEAVPTRRGSAPDMTVTGISGILGSPYYMSPEQVRSSRSVDVRADVWSLGVILYELLTARLPFEGSPATVLTAITEDAPRSLRQDRRDAPQGLETALLRCFEKDPDERWQSVGDLATALLPFAPERSHVSVERAVRVLGHRTGSRPSSRPDLDTSVAGSGASSPPKKLRFVPAKRLALGAAALCLLGVAFVWHFSSARASASTKPDATVPEVVSKVQPSSRLPSLATQFSVAPATTEPSTLVSPDSARAPGSNTGSRALTTERVAHATPSRAISKSPRSDDATALPEEPAAIPKTFDVEEATAARH